MEKGLVSVEQICEALSEAITACIAEEVSEDIAVMIIVCDGNELAGGGNLHPEVAQQFLDKVEEERVEKGLIFQ